MIRASKSNRPFLLSSFVAPFTGSPELQAVELQMAPILAAHESKIYTFPGLFARLDKLHETRLGSSLNAEQVRLPRRGGLAPSYACGNWHLVEVPAGPPG